MIIFQTILPRPRMSDMMTHAHRLADSRFEADLPGSLASSERESPGFLRDPQIFILKKELQKNRKIRSKKNYKKTVWWKWHNFTTIEKGAVSLN